MERRDFLRALAALTAASSLRTQAGGADSGQVETFEVVKTDEEWRRILTPEQYAVLRDEDTERPGSSPLNNEHRKGTFHCAGCGRPLFSSETKFDSRTGWPSFWAPLEQGVATTAGGILDPRTEVHCRGCGGHLGHVFKDGPPPTHLRYCINGVALKFKPA
ncbi:MAG TPA: peptide-methionine (R)-S-oxide reductase MsrB [Candidatus Binatia bacterium]|nr:peptide-methionine (R)-S-oxide reductase MsrB [Candidatus Binatia bacterium]